MLFEIFDDSLLSFSLLLKSFDIFDVFHNGGFSVSEGMFCLINNSKDYF